MNNQHLAIADVATAISQEDVMLLGKLAALTNVVILVSKSDNSSPEEIEVLRRSILEKLNASGIGLFKFPGQSAKQSPFTVCSVPSEDDETMDASLLMSSEYVEPLIPSDLGILMEQIFEKDAAACLRHHAAFKLVNGLRGSVAPSLSSPTACAAPSSVAADAGSPVSPALRMGGIFSTYVQAQIADHTQQEERLAQLRLAKWAADLQRSLREERAQYETLAKGDRAVWLNEKLDELDEDGSMDDSTSLRGSRHRHLKPGSVYDYGLSSINDPLGLLRLDELIRQRGWLALQVAGGFGILGAFAVWAARTWSTSNADWNWNWWREP